MKLAHIVDDVTLQEVLTDSKVAQAKILRLHIRKFGRHPAFCGWYVLLFSGKIKNGKYLAYPPNGLDVYTYIDSPMDLSDLHDAEITLPPIEKDSYQVDIGLDWPGEMTNKISFMMEVVPASQMLTNFKDAKETLDFILKHYFNLKVEVDEWHDRG